MYTLASKGLEPLGDELQEWIKIKHSPHQLFLNELQEQKIRIKQQIRTEQQYKSEWLNSYNQNKQYSNVMHNFA